MSHLFDLTGRNAIVTGGASGIGKAIAVGLAEAGANVLVADLNLPGAQATAKAVQSLGRQGYAFDVDVTNECQVEAMVARARDVFPSIDISFNIPGINIRKPVLELSLAEYKRVLEVNLVGVFICAKSVGKVMVEQRRGKMVNMSSIMGHISLGRLSAYASAKGGVSQLTRTLAVEWAPYGVNVNAICPGYTRTPLVAGLMRDEVLLADLTRRVPMGRLAEPEEIVGAAVFLSSDAASYVTGISLFVDGGFMAW